MSEAFEREMDALRARIEARLAEFFTGGALEESMRYSLLAGGKRIRPVLAMAFCRAAGARAEDALDFGCAVELLHTYSLIHDDLPCMDNDDLRRGRPTCHKVYGECVATLAGDALQAAAFRVALSAGPEGPRGDHARALAGRILAEAAGERGMCAGQYWDTLGSGQRHTAEELRTIDALKTGALLRAACQMGVAAAMARRDVPESCMTAAGEYAEKLGLAFQIRDDLLDVIATEEELGKPIGSDAANGKSTYVTLLGRAACEEQVQNYTERAKAALTAGEWAKNTEFLCEMAEKLAKRCR